MTGERLFTSFQIHNLTFCSNERTMCTNCLGFTVMQFYVVLLVTEWMCLFKITSVHLCSSSSSLLKWDNVLCSLRQVARMMLLSYPQNVSVTGIKQADNFSPSWSFQMIQDLFLKCVCNWLYLWIYFFFFEVHIITWFMIVLLMVPQCNTQRKWRSCRKTHSCKKEEEWNNSEFWHNG